MTRRTPPEILLDYWYVYANGEPRSASAHRMAALEDASIHALRCSVHIPDDATAILRYGACDKPQAHVECVHMRVAFYRSRQLPEMSDR